MKYVLDEPSLQQMAAVKIVSELWDREEIKKEIARYNFSRSYCFPIELGIWGEREDELKFKSIENNIKEKVRALIEIPEKLKKTHVAHLIRPLGLEMIKWWFLHRDFVARLPRRFFWTGRGTADNQKIAAVLVKDENEEVETRYKMACTYCSENDMRVLWERVPETRKPLFYDLKDVEECRNGLGWFGRRGPKQYRWELVAFWTYIINDKVSELYERLRPLPFTGQISHFELGFLWAAMGMNTSASRFFLEKLSDEERDKVLLTGVTIMLMPNLFHPYKAETILFLLGRLREEEQNFLFQYYVCEALDCMMLFPYQRFFLETAKKWFRFVPIVHSHYIGVFNQLRYKIRNGEEDYDYRELFREVWQLASVHDGDFFRMNDPVPYIFCVLIKLYSDEEADRTLVRDLLSPATDEEKEKLLYLKRIDGIHLPLVVERERWACLQFLLEECSLNSQQIVVNFQRALESQLSTEEDARSKVRLTTALQLVNDFVRKWK